MNQLKEKFRRHPGENPPSPGCCPSCPFIPTCQTLANRLRAAADHRLRLIAWTVSLTAGLLLILLAR